MIPLQTFDQTAWRRTEMLLRHELLTYFKLLLKNIFQIIVKSYFKLLLKSVVENLVANTYV